MTERGFTDPTQYSLAGLRHRRRWFRIWVFVTVWVIYAATQGLNPGLVVLWIVGVGLFALLQGTAGAAIKSGGELEVEARRFCCRLTLVLVAYGAYRQRENRQRDAARHAEYVAQADQERLAALIAQANRKQ